MSDGGPSRPDPGSGLPAGQAGQVGPVTTAPPTTAASTTPSSAPSSTPSPAPSATSPDPGAVAAPDGPASPDPARESPCRAAPKAGRRQRKESHRRRLTRRLRELHVRLRTEGDSPRERAFAVALGTLVGCVPVYGLHLFLCTVLARIFHLSRVYTYMAANLNNPLTLPFLLFVEMKVGHRVLEGDWPELSLAAFRQRGILGFGADVLVGSVVLGIVLGLLFGALTWLLSRGRKPDPFHVLREAAAEPYLAAGVTHWEFVRAKLRYDPMYRGILEAGLLPRRGRLVDLGCGRGILLSLLVAVADAAEDDEVIAPMELIGIELRPSHARAARRALSELPHQPDIEIRRGDLTEEPVPPCDTGVLLDVLHYLPAAGQVDLLGRVAEKLRPGGMLLVREADADAGLRFALTRSAERLMTVLRGHFRQRFRFRGLGEWEALLTAAGLVVESRPMSDGTPYGNVLLVAHKPGGNAEAARHCDSDRGDDVDWSPDDAPPARPGDTP